MFAFALYSSVLFCLQLHHFLCVRVCRFVCCGCGVVSVCVVRSFVCFLLFSSVIWYCCCCVLCVVVCWCELLCVVAIACCFLLPFV